MATSFLTAGRLILDSNIYPNSCVEAAAAAYAKFLKLDAVREADTLGFDVVVFPTFSSKGTQLRREFLNYLLDLSIQHHLQR